MMNTNMKICAITILATIPIFGAGSVGQSINPLGPPPSPGGLPDNRPYVMSITWIGDSVNGTVPSTVINIASLPQIQGMRLFQIEIQPGTPSPSANYSITLTDGSGIDLLQSLGANLNAINASFTGSMLSPPLLTSPTFNLSGNSVASARGTVTLYFAPLSTVAAARGLPATLPAAQTFTGVNTFSGDTRLPNVGTFNVQEWVGTTQYPTLASAIAAATPSTLIHVPSGTFQISGTQTIATNNISIICDGPFTSFIQITSATANYFSVSSNGFEIGNCGFNSSVNRTAGFLVVNGAGNGVTPTTWKFHDLTLQDVYGGFQILANNNNAIADVNIYNITWRTTAGLHTGSFLVVGGGTATTGGVTVIRAYTPVSAAISDAPQIILDTLADTIHLIDYHIGYSAGIAQTQPVIKFQNTGAGVPPKFVRLESIAIESGGSASTADCINIAAGADILISDSYIANCGNEAINISGGNNINGPLRVHHNWIGNNQKGGIYVSPAITASADIEIDGNSLNANSINTTNTFDDIQIAANTIGFSILGNHNGNQVFSSANKSRYGTNILAGTSALYWYSGNTCDSAQMGTSCLLDGGTGSPKHVEFPNLFMTVTATPNTSAPVITMSDTAGRCGLITGVDSINNMRVGTCSGGQQLDLVSGNQVVAASLDGTTQNMTVKNIIASKGTACTNGELALSAGWQSTGTATVTAVVGTGQTCSWTITTGTTTAANPTVTDTLTNPVLATVVCEMNIHGGTHTPAAGEGFQQTTLSATAPIFTFNGTPTAGGATYFVTRQCGP